MDYFDRYAERMRVRGPLTATSEEDRMIASMRQDWESNPSFRLVCVKFPNGTTKQIRIQTSRKTVGMDKIYVHPDDALESGCIILSLQDYAWLVLDVRYIGHVFQQANIVRINRTLKWIDNNAILETMVRVKGYSRVDGVDEYYYFTIPENTINIFLPKTEQTVTINRDRRFIIDGLPYKVSKVDNFTHTGVTILFAMEDLGHENDTDEIADYVEITPETPVDTYVIEGLDILPYGGVGEYTLTVNNTTVTPIWSMLDSPAYAYLVVDGSIATITIESSLKHIGKVVVLQAVYEEQTYLKSILISSLV